VSREQLRWENRHFAFPNAVIVFGSAKPLR
jgi:hypothetical protein